MSAFNQTSQFINTMLVEFLVSNYRSISDEQILSLVPSEQQEYLNNIIEKGTYNSMIKFFFCHFDVRRNLDKSLTISIRFLKISPFVEMTKA
jgi:hypothetical protein